MNREYVTHLIDTAKKAEELLRQIDSLQEYLKDIEQHQLKATLSVEKLCPAPSEYSNDKVWSTVFLNCADYTNFERICTEALKTQLMAQLDAKTKELEELHV